jgi:hypothetical protein
MCRKFGPGYARQLKKRQGRLGDAWYLDEACITIHWEQPYLWRAVDQDGDTVDIIFPGVNFLGLRTEAFQVWQDGAHETLTSHGLFGTFPIAQK